MSGRAAYVPTAHDLARRERAFLWTPGLYAVRLAKGAPEVAAEVRYEPTPDPYVPGNPMDRPHYWTLWIDGEQRHGPHTVPMWQHTGRPIDDAEYRLLLAQSDWDRKHARNSPRGASHGVDAATLF